MFDFGVFLTNLQIMIIIMVVIWKNVYVALKSNKTVYNTHKNIINLKTIPI